MNCSFCGKEIPLGKEKIFVNKKGEALYFCSKKCEKNLLKLKRKPREIRWTKAYIEEKKIRVKSVSSQTSTKRKTKK